VVAVQITFNNPRVTILRVKDIMNRDTVYVRKGEFLTRVRSIMRESGYRTIPVVDEKGKLLGVVKERDVVKVIDSKSDVTVDGFIEETLSVSPEMDLVTVAEIMIRSEVGRLPVVDNGKVIGMISIVDIFKHVNPDRNIRVPVRDVMTERVVVCSKDDRISKVLAYMRDFEFSAIPVVDGSKNLVGIVTRADIIRKKAIPNAKVEKFMTRDVITVDKNTSVSEAYRIMLEKDIGRLPVVENGKLVGIVDRYDILGCVIGGM